MLKFLIHSTLIICIYSFSTNVFAQSSKKIQSSINPFLTTAAYNQYHYKRYQPGQHYQFNRNRGQRYHDSYRYNRWQNSDWEYNNWDRRNRSNWDRRIERNYERGGWQEPNWRYQQNNNWQQNNDDNFYQDRNWRSGVNRDR